MTRPLEGLRVVDAATILAGPFAASILGEFGADVVKVEQPGVGDPMRRLGTEAPDGDTWVPDDSDRSWHRPTCWSRTSAQEPWRPGASGSSHSGNGTPA